MPTYSAFGKNTRLLIFLTLIFRKVFLANNWQIMCAILVNRVLGARGVKDRNGF